MRSGIGNDPSDPFYTAQGASKTYTLASNITVANAGASTPVAGIQGGSYIFDAQFTGTSIKLQSLGADGATWRDVTTLNASGSVGVVLGQGASVRLQNPNGTNDTGVYATLT